jgi:hypothetical protein
MLVRNGLQLRMSVWSTVLGVALNGVAQFGDAALQLEHRRRGPTPVESGQPAAGGHFAHRLPLLTMPRRRQAAYRVTTTALA